MVAGIRETGAHEINRDVVEARRGEDRQFANPGLRAVDEVDTALDFEGGGIPPQLLNALAHCGRPGRLEVRRRDLGRQVRLGEEETVAEARRPFPGDLAHSAEPDRDVVSRARGDASAVDAVPPPAEIDDLIPPESTQQQYLLLLPSPTGGEVGVETRILDVVPADADAQPEPTVGEHGHLGRLLSHEGGLPLRKYEYSGGETDPRRQSGHEGEQGERFVEGVELGVGPPQWRFAVRSLCPEHVVERKDVREPEAFRRLREVLHCGGIGSGLGLGGIRLRASWWYQNSPNDLAGRPSRKALTPSRDSFSSTRLLESPCASV